MMDEQRVREILREEMALATTKIKSAIKVTYSQQERHVANVHIDGAAVAEAIRTATEGIKGLGRA